LVNLLYYIKICFYLRFSKGSVLKKKKKIDEIKEEFKDKIKEDDKGYDLIKEIIIKNCAKFSTLDECRLRLFLGVAASYSEQNDKEESYEGDFEEFIKKMILTQIEQIEKENSLLNNEDEKGEWVSNSQKFTPENIDSILKTSLGNAKFLFSKGYTVKAYMHLNEFLKSLPTPTVEDNFWDRIVGVDKTENVVKYLSKIMEELLTSMRKFNGVEIDSLYMNYVKASAIMFYIGKKVFPHDALNGTKILGENEVENLKEILRFDSSILPGEVADVKELIKFVVNL
jgi:hypothetical protein